MHLLAAEPGAISDGASAVDLGQTPADIVVLTAASTEIACLATAQTAVTAAAQTRGIRGGVPTLRLANILRLGHNLSVDLYLDSVVAPQSGRGAQLVVARLLGGRGY